MAEDTRASHLRILAEKKQKKTDARIRVMGNYYGLLAVCIFIPIILVLITLWQFWQEFNFLYVFIFINVLVIILAATFSILIIARAARIELERELDFIEFDFDLLQRDVSQDEIQAEKVLRINELQLRRYYNLNINQNNLVFMLGIICIFLGLGVIAITMYIIVVIQSDTDTKIIMAVIGSIGSLLSGYVAAVYLKMHAKAASHLESFHSRLVGTHQLLLGNLLASRIEDDQKRWETLSQLALNMAKMSQ